MRAWLSCAGFVVAGAGLGLPALMYDVRSRGAESYIRLAKEILDRQARAVSGSGEAA